MTAEELSKPRFEVIANYPCAIHELGKIIECNSSCISYSVEIGDISEKIDLSEYPNIFRMLNWWENRNKDDMPKKVMSLADDNKDVFEIEEWDMKILVGWIDKNKRECCSLLSFKPEYGYIPID